MDKKVLMIAYYFPPVGSGGVQRTSKFVKYLKVFGWNPIVLTVNNRVYRKTHRDVDLTLIKDIPKGTRVVRTLSLDFKRISTSIKDKCHQKRFSVKSLVKKIGDLVIHPDSQMPWIPIAVDVGKKLIKKYHIDVIYSTGNPWSDHVIGAALHKITGIPFIADYRDAWNLHPYLTYYSSRMRRKIQLFLETKVIEYAHRIVFATEEMEMDYRKVFGNSSKFSTIRNGVDLDDFKSSKPKVLPKFTILYAGNIWSYTNPSYLIYAVSNWLKKYPQVRKELNVSFLGRIDREIKSLIDKEDLVDVVNFRGYLPHTETIALLLGAHVLLLTINDGGESILTGKIFEYLAAGKPILALVPPSGMAADLLRKEGRGEHIVNPKDVIAIENHLMSLFTEYKNGCLPTYPVENLQDYTRRKATEKLSKLLDSLKR